MHKKIACLLVAVMIVNSFPISNAAVAAKKTNATLIWSDEFNKKSLDTSNWTYDIGTGSNGWGNNELQYYTNNTENVSVSNGVLRIKAVKENYNGCSYTSGRIKTQGLKAFKYGKIEARIAAPSGQGLWPACWMLGDNFSSAGWPYCGEIDIFEHINKENKIYGTVHWDSNGHASYGANTNGIDVTKYHIYSITWDDDYIRWYVDSRQYHEILIKDGTGGTEEFQKEFFLLLNLAVGGNWPKSPDTSTSFPAAMYVDYIRVYKYNGQGGSQSTPDNPTTNPNTPANTDGIMRYTDKDKASASLSNIAWADIHYKVNNGVQMNIRMSQSGTTASYTISGLKKNDVVSYWFTNCDTSGFAKDGSKSIYKHTPEYTNLLLNSTVANSNISSYNALNMDTDVNSAFNKSSFISNSWYGMPNLWYPVFEQKLY